MIKKLFIFMVLVSVASFAHGAEVSASCPDQRPSASLQYKSNIVKYVRTESSKELSFHKAGRRVLGLAGGESVVRFWAKYDAFPNKGRARHYCLETKNINVIFTAKPTIHIASNFKRGSCEYNNVLKHEQKHVKVTKRAHREFLPKLKEHLNKTVRSLPRLEPTSLSGLNAQKQKIAIYVNQAMQSYLNTVIMPEIAKRQRAVDTREEYAEVIAKCKNWKKKLNN